MKKFNYLFCLASLLALTNVSLTGQTQLKKWFINGKSIDFSQSTPLVEDMAFSPNAGVDLLSESTLKVAPNPVGDWMSFEYILPEGQSSATIIIRDALGRTVKTLDINDSEGQIIFETHHLPRGMYIYLLTINGEQQKVNQFVIAR